MKQKTRTKGEASEKFNCPKKRTIFFIDLRESAVQKKRKFELAIKTM